MASGGNNMNVIIIGAGLTGLLIAQGLKKANVKCTVYEAEESSSPFKKREWGMSIHWSRPLVEALLPPELWESFESHAQVDPSFNVDEHPDFGTPTYDMKTGKHIMTIPMPKGLRVSRRKSRIHAFQGIEIQYGKKLVDVSFPQEGVIVKFEDGTEVTGSLLIGADGHRSTVRSMLFNDPQEGEAQPIMIGSKPLQLATMNASYNDTKKALTLRNLHILHSLGLCPDIQLSMWTAMSDVPDPEDPSTWVFQLTPIWPGSEILDATSNSERLKILKEIANEFSDPWKSAIQWVPEDTPVAISKLSYWATRLWDHHDGRVVIAGDAAHPMPPHRGQGLNNSIQDAFNIVEAIKSVKDGKASITQAITAYMEEVVKRGADEVTRSVLSATVSHTEKPMDAPVFQHGYQRPEI